MLVNRVQFQAGLSMPEFIQQFGNEVQCEVALEQARWPAGFRCPRCGNAPHCVLHVRARKTFQCNACGHQTSLIAGTVFQSTKLPLAVWFLAIYLVSQAKTGLSALALSRLLGVSYPTAWMIHHKLMQTMAERETGSRLGGHIQVDDAYLGGELPGGKAGRGSENKVSFIAAVSLDAKGHPSRAKLTPVSGFTSKSVAAWAKTHLEPGSTVISDGLACFGAVSEAHCEHICHVVGGRKPRELPEFRWVNTLLGNVKTSLTGAYHAFDFCKYAYRYLAAITYRFNRRFQLKSLPQRLLAAAVATTPHPEPRLRLAEVHC